MATSDPIDELVSRSKDHRELRAFHKLHRAHPEILDFLVLEIKRRFEHGFQAFSFHSLWEYAGWKLEMDRGPGETFLMNDHAVPFYARAITILHPEFNGRAELRKSITDTVFGTALEALPPKRGNRRLQWADGTPLEQGWRPSLQHVPRRTVRVRRDIHPRGSRQT